jgi:PmbA protein
MRPTTPDAFRERLWEAATVTRDLLAHGGPDRWEFFAKASSTVTAELATGDRITRTRTEETGVAIRTFTGGRSGFAAGSGLGVDASRRALEGAASAASPTATDPLPPPHLLGTVELGGRRFDLDPEWAESTARQVAREVDRSTHGAVALSHVAVRSGSWAWVLATGDGFVVSWEDAAASVTAELELGGSHRGAWRERLPVIDPGRFDAAEAADRITSRALLTLGRTTVDSGLKDLLLHPEVAAHLVAGLVPLMVVSPAEEDLLPPLLNRDGELASRALTLVDTRTDHGAPVTAPCDGEGVPSARTLLLERGVPRHRLGSYRDAIACGEAPRGGAVRLSYRTAPRTGPTNLRVETDGGLAPAELLRAAGQALYLLRPVAPVECDLARGDYRIIASGVWLDGGVARGWHPIVELRGSLGTLLRRIDAVGTDRAWFDTPYGAVGAPSMLIRRQPVVR